MAAEPLRHPYAAYWDRGEPNVPDMTGAKRLLDGRDLKTILMGFGLTIPVPGKTLDIGCGTGRMAQLCTDYTGVDIALSAVSYCLARGISASLIAGPDDLPDGPFHLVTAISVMTHIGRVERQELLAAIARRTDRVLVDIIPGDGEGGVALWTAVPAEFVADLAGAGFSISSAVTYMWDANTHQYFYARKG